MPAIRMPPPRLPTAPGMLGLLIGATLWLGACSVAPPAPEPVAAPEPVIVEAPAPVPEPTAEELAAMRAAVLACERITIAAVGDIMIGTDFPKDTLPDDDAVSLLADVTPVLAAADVAVGNLEGVLMDGGMPFKQCENPDACYLFRSPARYAQRLADAGFDVMSLANNHARDFGEDGRTASMAALAAAGIRHSGRVGDIARWQQGDISLAFIAFAPFTNSWPMLDLEIAAGEVASLAAEHDIVIVSFHGGAEGVDAARVPFTTERYYGEDRGDVVEFSRTLIAAGADLVVGHGPHVPRAMEIRDNRLIAYSLGNFATYYGISVAGTKGYAPILLATLDGNGQLRKGQVVSAIQQRPQGPLLDPANRAGNMMRELTDLDFSGGAIEFAADGQFAPISEPVDACSE